MPFPGTSGPETRELLSWVSVLAGRSPAAKTSRFASLWRSREPRSLLTDIVKTRQLLPARVGVGPQFSMKPNTARYTASCRTPASPGIDRHHFRSTVDEHPGSFWPLPTALVYHFTSTCFKQHRYANRLGKILLSQVYAPALIFEQEKVNLARIRDNQRRSRLRRREYLQELETRLRQFELHGIEASAEIQMAARKVADENRKLRGLLALHGIREDSIEVYSQSSSAGDVQLTSRIPSYNAPVQAIEHLLQTHKPWSETSISTTPFSWDLSRLPVSGAFNHTGKATDHQLMTSSSTAGSTISSVSYHSHQRPLVPASLPRNPSPTLMTGRPQMSQPNLPQYADHQTAAQNLQSRSTLQSLYIPSTTGSCNVNSSIITADMISAMAGEDPNTMSADMGCLPGVDCEVKNRLVF